MPLKSILRRSALVLVSGLVVAVAAELLLGAVGAQYERRFQERLVAGQSARTDAIRILALGESTTGGLWCTPTESYPKQLEALLRVSLGTDRIEVVVPFHVGQNSSQILHRLPSYLAIYRPALVILMVGVNNTWSLSESNIRFLIRGSDLRSRLARLRLRLDELKLFKVARWIGSGLDRVERHLSGEPEETRFPPPPSSLVLRAAYPEAFRDLWRSDVGALVRTSRAAGAEAVLMTYPRYAEPPAEEFLRMARTENVVLVRNDLLFERLVAEGGADRFLFEDGHHPRPEGYRRLAEALRDVILDRPEMVRRLSHVAVPAKAPDPGN